MKREVTFASMALITTSAFIVSGASAGSVQLQVRVENLAPANGIYHSPVWVGFHNGSFDYFNAGGFASPALEGLAEDANTAQLMADFTGSGIGATQGAVSNGMPFAPGEVATSIFALDNNDPNARYFSYGSMVVPSNDAFMGNDNPMAHEIFDASGNFIGADFIVLGSNVWDAGVEVNDEIPMNTAFFGQTTPNTGDDENGVVHLHTGYMSPGSGGVLDDPMFANADFTAQGYQIARITVTQVPAPGALALFGATGLLGIRRRRRRT